ncbi:MAG: hypothetical protein WA814_02400 [Candidatus Baltobacteraceae bacterium]
MAVNPVARDVVKSRRPKNTAVAFETEVELWITHAEINEPIGCGKSAIGILAIKNERDRSKGRMAYDKANRERRRVQTHRYEINETPGPRLRGSSFLFGFRVISLYNEDRKDERNREFAELKPALLLPKPSVHSRPPNLWRLRRGSFSHDSRKMTKVIFLDREEF